MQRVSEREIGAIVRRVVERIQAEGVAPAPAAGQPVAERREAPPGVGAGLFDDVHQAVEAAELAQAQLARLTLAKRREIIDHVRHVIRENVNLLAWMAVDETGMGRYEDKIEKNLLLVNKTPGPEFLEPRVITGDRGLMLNEWAPFGVTVAITPTTNPSETVINNGICLVSAGNSVVFNPHPRARRVSNKAVELIHQAVVEAGGPPNLVSSIREPTVDSAQALMHHQKVCLIVVTGGIGVVREALQAGKRAVCAGPGNPPVVADETCDIEQAARDMVAGASLDNNIVCTDEKEFIVVEAAADRIKAAMREFNAVELSSWQLKRLEKVIFKEHRGDWNYSVMNTDWIGKNASVILREIGMSVDDSVRLALAEVPSSHTLVWSEQMMPLMPLVRVRNVDEAIDLAVRAEHGFRHCSVIHSRNTDHITRMARAINTSIFVANGPSFAGLGQGGEGYTSYSIGTFTGDGMTTPRTFSRERRVTLVDNFRVT